MNKFAVLTAEQQKLVAAYLAGDAVGDELLHACQQDPNVLNHLSQLVANDRLLASELSVNNTTNELSQKVLERIKNSTQPSPISEVKQNIIHTITKQSWFEKPFAMAASIAALVSVLFLSSYVYQQQSLAQITKIAGAGNQFTIGHDFSRGDIEFNQGYSEITLSNGVVLVLEAPVKLRLESADQVILSAGKLVARVPHNAIGFRIDTPSSEIVDLGTEFGVEVAANGESQVHVLDGEVKARANNLQHYQHAKKDQALAFNLKHEVTSIKSIAGDFMRVLPGKSAQDPDFLHWSFDEKQQQQFPSNGKGIYGQQFAAIDQSANSAPVATTQGVFGQGITFDGEGNWLKTNFPGIGNDDPRTVSFWVKVPKDFSTQYAYGVVSWGLLQDYAAWQISPNPETIDGPLGRLRIGTFQAQVVGATDLRDGNWHHIAVVLYAGEHSDISTHVLLYVDGQLEKTQKKSIAKVDTKLNHPQSRPLSLGRNIGYEDDAPHVEQKFFKGSVDELYIFEAALDQQQIQQLMNSNHL